MKRLKTKIIVLISIFLIVVASITTIVFAAFTKTSTRGDIEVSADTLTATTTYTSKQEEYDWTYTKAGDTKEIEISTKNESDFILHRYYMIEKNTNKTNDNNLLSAIMVYYNDKYIGQLIDVIENQIEIYDEYVFVEKTKTKTDSLKFELHQAASNSIFDSKDISINITTYTENANYLNNIFVSTEEEFKHAVDDINSGLFTNIPKIVLCNTLTLNNSYTILNPACIYLNGSTLNGSLELNDTDALLEVLGDGTFNVDVTLTKYDSDKAKELVINNIKDKLKYGISSGDSIDILEHYAFYNHTISANATVTYTKPNLIAPSVSNTLYSKAGQITVAGEKISFKVKGSKTALLEDTLKHLPSNDSILTTDLFLPTYIPSENAVITWLSSNEDILTSDGKIAARRIDSEEVSLYAEIKINDTVLTRTYTFKVSAHNNEINFYKLVQEISPIVINNIYSSIDDSDNALYHLPIVSQNNDGTFNNYDYRTSYESPVNTKLFDWSAYRDIGLENITYSMTAEELAAYEYITLSDNELYLNTTTLNNYAKINITGDFGNDETYTTTIHVSIAVGTDTQLLEKAFTQISEELDTISVLGNILKTRKTSGMKNEKGDFTLTSVYLENSDYTIEFSGESDIIPSIVKDLTEDKYNFSINPEYFNEYETTVAFSATVYYKKGTEQEKSKSRTFYVVVPAALHVKDFTTISIYNATKYQVFNQLRGFEKSGETGYAKSGSTLTDSNLDYILLRDIVGDESYISEYKASNYYLDVAELTESTYALGVKTLNYNVNNTNDSNATDTAAYDFIKLIQWATSEGRESASSVVTNTSALGSLGSTKSNNEDYLNNDEIAVLKQYYMASTSSTEDEWNNLYKEVFNVAPGYIYTNPALLNTVLKCLSYQITGENYYSEYKDYQYLYTTFSTIFGKYMEIIQRYAVSTTKVNDKDVAPCQEIYNTRYVWTHTPTNDTTIGISNDVININGTGYTATYSIQLADGTWWQRFNYAGKSAGDGKYAGIYARSAYAADRTSYITEAELTVLRIFLLNAVTKQDYSPYTNYIDNSVSNSNLQLIQETLNAYPDYYSSYSISDFNKIAKAILNAFNACMEIPTYFSTDGVAKIIKSFYDKKGYDLPTYDETTNTTPFKSSLNGDIPYITNADNIKSVLSYFINLEQLYINGSPSLSAFLSENGISTVFSRTGLYNAKIKKLTMKYSAHSNVNFDLANIKNFSKLTQLNLSNNYGIKSVNELVNVNRSKYILVNIEHIGVEYAFQEFAIDNIASPTCTVYYTNDDGIKTYSNDNSMASDLADLSDFNKFISQYMYMTNVVSDEDGNETSITWRIDEGNEIGNIVNNPGKYNEIATISEMNQYVSPYYYCNESFTYENGDFTYNFIANHFYKLSYNNGFKISNLGTAIKSNTTDVTIGKEYLDTSGYSQELKESSYLEYTGDGNSSILDTIVWYDENTQPVTITISAQNYYKNVAKSRYIQYTCFSGIPGEEKTTTAVDTSNPERVRMFFLEYSEVDSIINRKYTSSVTITKSINNNTDYYFCFIHNEQLYLVGSTNDTLKNDQNISVTTDLNSALMFRLITGTKTNSYSIKVSNKNFYIRERDSNVLTYHGNKDDKASFYYDSGTDAIINGLFTVEYNDGSVEKYYAKSVGYDVVKIENATIKYSNLKKISASEEIRNTSHQYYMYTGEEIEIDGITIKPNTIVDVYSRYEYAENEIKREYTKPGSTFYFINVWYINYNENTKKYLENPAIITSNIKKIHINKLESDYIIADIRSNYPSNTYGTSSSYSYVYKDKTYEYGDEEYSNIEQFYTNFTSTWEPVSSVISPYISYATMISSDDYNFMDKRIEFYQGIDKNYSYVFRYSGTTGKENIYRESSTGVETSYKNKAAYKLVVSDGILNWEYYANSVGDSTGTTMDSILEEANQHFDDYLYGYYYGRYYGYKYDGVERYIRSGIYIRPGYVYRIMPNETNTAFEWQVVSKYVYDTSDNILQQLGTGQIKVGDICYSTKKAMFGFFDIKWYKVVLDEKTNIVNLVRFNDLGFDTDSEITYTQLTNDKLVPRSGDYLGYSGTFNVQISALIRIKQADGSYIEYIKTYKMKFVGSLTS